ncbi:MAG: ATP-binding cassette domain-containing protein [Veillonella sp.]|nr:ATP-binding cassette domain-containing protein [Veillonella sp.]
MAYIEFSHVSFVDGERQVLKDVDLSIEKGEYVTFVGPSGSGKSTLLKLCSDLISPTSGQIVFDGKPISDYEPTVYRQRVGYCFQQPYLFGRTVRDNLVFPFEIRGESFDPALVLSWLERLGLPADYLDKENDLLSGGEKQRVCLIRSLLFMPEVLLLDEVTSALDPDNTILVEGLLQDLRCQHGLTILAVTHNEAQSVRHVDRRVRIEAGRVTAVDWLQGTDMAVKETNKREILKVNDNRKTAKKDVAKEAVVLEGKSKSQTHHQGGDR